MTSCDRQLQKIIKTAANLVEVLAVPGSGKTHALIERIKYLSANGVSARDILVLSFSNASVAEVVRRIHDSGSDLSQVTVSTVHAFAIGLIPKQTVLKEGQARALLVKAIQSVRRDCQTGVLFPNISTAVKQRRLRMLDKLLTQADLVLRLFQVTSAARRSVAEVTTKGGAFEGFGPYVKALQVVGDRFSALKEKHGVIDYGDMIIRAINAIKSGRSVPFKHILVDEYQDSSPAQVHLLAELAGLENRSIMVFGDADQAIFNFAGSRYTRLSNVLSGVDELRYPTSRRLTRQIAALASAVAGHAPGETIQARRDGEVPVLVCDRSLRSQIRHMCEHVQYLLAEGTPRREIVVLARVNALLQPVEQALLAQGISTTRIGVRRNRRHALRVLKLVRLVERCDRKAQKPKTEMLRKVLPRLERQLGDAGKRAVRDLSKVSRAPSLEGRYRQCAKTYLRLLGGVRRSSELRADINRWEPLCRRYRSAQEMRAAIRAMDTEGVVTGTIHSAKGGEWNEVLVAGVTDGYLPHYLARDRQSVSEERRLLYVAVTRARNTVRLFHAPQAHARSRQRFEKLSRILDNDAVRSTLRIR
jgi:DNA helicase-2/ATP-dependent DNA helicase PcrA